ncbi:hypothetical protein [Candidatus Tisiphia endosymbiont of Mystacides longicornis]|uniref:hypothetical protein n=1 Tax=Candidatus Tisiphia endosymbiont of Mystacides longicornis TaxID=3139330 RepID=UPI003CCB1FD2
MFRLEDTEFMLVKSRVINMWNIESIQNGTKDICLTNKKDVIIDNTDKLMEPSSWIKVIPNTTLTIMGELPFETFVLQPKSTIKFSYNGTAYNLANTGSQELGVQNMFLLIDTCKFLETSLAENEEHEVFEIKEYHSLAYKNLDKDLINLFAQQNDKQFASLIEYASIIKSSSELSDLAKNLLDSYSSESEDGSDYSFYSTESLSKLWSNKSEDAFDCSSSSWELSDVNPSMEGDQVVPLVGTKEEHFE